MNVIAMRGFLVKIVKKPPALKILVMEMVNAHYQFPIQKLALNAVVKQVFPVLFVKIILALNHPAKTEEIVSSTKIHIYVNVKKEKPKRMKN